MRRGVLTFVALLTLLGVTVLYVRPLCAQSLRDPMFLSQDSSQFLAEQRLGDVDIHEEMGTPTDADPRDDLLLRRRQYAVSYNPLTHNPNWVSYNLSAYWYGDVPRHKGMFQPDPLIPADSFRTVHRDYTNSGYDRGHLCRSEERTRTDDDNLTTFYMTNVIPQRHGLNAGPWLKLEDHCMKLCKERNKELFVVTGPVYDGESVMIGRGVRVPSACFKVVVVLPKGHARASVTSDTRVIAVIMPNTDEISREPWQSYLCTVGDIEQRTGYDFLSALPVSLQRVLESRRDSGTE
ncbi:MAG: DNA/RNA non-specific endonuclease [Candidatus Kapaibacterium sp.]